MRTGGRTYLVIPWFTIAFFLPDSVGAQVALKGRIVDAETRVGVSLLVCKVLQNGDYHIGYVNTDMKGNVYSRLWVDELDKDASYQIEPTYRYYLPDTVQYDTTWNNNTFLIPGQSLSGEYLRKRYAWQPFLQDFLLCEVKKDSTFNIQLELALRQREAGMVCSGCSLKNFGNYEPRTPTSMMDLPAEIRLRLEKHLVERLGPDFYRNLKLTGGHIVDLRRLYVVNPSAQNYRWTPYSYYLCFSMRDTTKGVGLYSAEIVLDSVGNVVKEIAFPPVATYPEKANIISRDAAIGLALQRQEFSEKTLVEMGYDAQLCSLIWRMSNTTYYDDHTLSVKTLRIDAHSGAILEYGYGGGIWD